MKRCFRVLDDTGDGRLHWLVKPYTLIGRSRHADLQIQGDDLLISRRHLEVRIDPDAQAVFVKNISSQGSSLNGKRLSGVVSLSSGDVLEIGHTKLRFEEAADDECQVASSNIQPSNQASSSSGDDIVVELDRTRVASQSMDRTRIASQPIAEMNESAEDESCPDATRAVADDATRALVGKDLPNWKAPEQKKVAPQRRKATLFGCTAAALLVVCGFSWWALRRDKASAHASLEVKDSNLGYNLAYPADWSIIRSSDPAQTSERDKVITLGVGKEDASPVASHSWARVAIRADKSPDHALTGLTRGFAQYEEILRKRHKDFELIGKMPFVVNEVKVINYGFSTPTLKGLGIYVLNAESRIVVECYCPQKFYDEYAPLFIEKILQTFHLPGDTQQMIDFPLPTSAMQQLALANPAQLARQVEQHTRRGDALVATREVRPDNLYQAIQEYRQALQLATASSSSKPVLPGYAPAARALSEANKLFARSLERQRFELNRAVKERDQTAAFFAAHKMMQMLPEKSDPLYQEAFNITKAATSN